MQKTACPVFWANDINKQAFQKNQSMLLTKLKTGISVKTRYPGIKPVFFVSFSHDGTVRHENQFSNNMSDKALNSCRFTAIHGEANSCPMDNSFQTVRYDNISNVGINGKLRCRDELLLRNVNLLRNELCQSHMNCRFAACLLPWRHENIN